MHKAHLVGVYTLREMPEELTGFVKFQAKLERHELRMDEAHRPAGDRRHIIVRARCSWTTISDLTEDRRRSCGTQDAEMDNVTRESLIRVIAGAPGTSRA